MDPGNQPSGLEGSLTFRLFGVGSVGMCNITRIGNAFEFLGLI